MSDDENADDTRYGYFRTDDDDVVVYDRHNPEAWIQSTYAVTVGTQSEREPTA